MTDSDVFGKLSRIFETHAFSKDDSGLNDFLDDFDPNNIEGGYSGQNSPNKKRMTISNIQSSEKVTPFDVWQQRTSKNIVKQKPTKKLNDQQWDQLVEKMHHSNRVKQNAIVKEQNKGLAIECGGFRHQPRINKHSSELSATMKSLSTRLEKMTEEKKTWEETKKKEAQENEIADCTFKPQRTGAKASDQMLRKMGREKVTAEDLFKYEQEKQRRIEVRKNIVTEIEDKELTFKPQLGEKSIKLQEKLIQRGMIDIDPLTRTTIVTATPNPKDRSRLARTGNTPMNLTPSGMHTQNSFFSADNPNDTSQIGGLPSALPYYEGPMLLIESEHPYRHNTNEYTTVAIPNAISYSITFSPNTKTEAIFDYIKFFDDDTHTEYFGCGKYSGGTNDSPCNWPGVGNRPPLTIIAPKFIIHFRSNGTLNDYGFQMYIVPTLAVVDPSPKNRNLLSSFTAANLHSDEIGGGDGTFTPQITGTAKNYNISNATNYTKNRMQHANVRVHERLYQHAVDKSVDYHNSQVDLMQNKLNIALKPWESVRGSGEAPTTSNTFYQANAKTHLPKSTLSEAVEELMIPELGGSHNHSPHDAYGYGAMDHNSPHNQNNLNASVDLSRLSLNQLNTTQLSKTGVREHNLSIIKGVPVAVVEFDDSYASLWKQLRSV